MKLKNQGKVFKMSLLALNLALYIVLSFVSFNLQFTRISMTGIPVIFVSVIFGPLEGVFVGLVGEFIYQLMSYGLMPSTILWLLPPVARALIVGFMFKHKDVKQHPVLWAITIILSCLAVTTINTISLLVTGYLVLETDSKLIFIALITRIGNSILSAVIFGIFTPFLFRPLINQGKIETTEN